MQALQGQFPMFGFMTTTLFNSHSNSREEMPRMEKSLGFLKCARREYIIKYHLLELAPRNGSIASVFLHREGRSSLLASPL